MEEPAEPRRPLSSIFPRPMGGLSVDELTDYIVALQQEIGRAEAEVAKRRQVRGAAEARFRPSSGPEA